MRRLADVLVVYTETERAQLLELHPGASVLARARTRSIRLSASAPADLDAGPPDTFVYVGRLVRHEEAAPAPARPSSWPGRTLPQDVRALFVGDGPLRAELERRARPPAEPTRSCSSAR